MSDTMDRTETPKRKRQTRRGGEYVTDAELIEKLNVPEKIARAALRALDANPGSGFPKPQKLWGDRRYWPAVKLWLDKTNGLTVASPPTAPRGRHE